MSVHTTCLHGISQFSHSDFINPSLMVMASCFVDELFPKGYTVICHQCQEPFSNKQSLVEHLRIEHGTNCSKGYPMYLCDECFYVSQNNHKGFKKHKEYHKLSHVYRCNKCWFLSVTELGIGNHARVSPLCSPKDLVEIRDGVPTPLILG